MQNLFLFYVNPQAGKSITNVNLISENTPAVGSTISFFTVFWELAFTFQVLERDFLLFL